MKISIFGLGYVGCVSLGCIAQEGHKVIGVDINKTKVELINKGKPTVVEKEIDRIINEQWMKGNISATEDDQKAVHESELSIICVGTPSSTNGHLDLQYIYSTAKSIGKALATKSSFHVVSIRSTVLPGTNQKVGEIIEQESSKKRNINFGVVSNPEFLREGTSVADYYNPPYTIIGSDSRKAIEMIKRVYGAINAPLKVVDIKVAELIKYVNNSFHALKITFANEVGNICKKFGIDSHELMDIFTTDTKLNISKTYLKPGFAYGGSCLPKDLKALNTIAHDYYLNVSVINAIEQSNVYQKYIIISRILEFGFQKIGIIGISFKAGTDDLRNSPIIDVIEVLIGKGKEIEIYDNLVNVSKLVGMNKDYIVEKLPHINSLLKSNISEVINNNKIIVVTNDCYEMREIDISDDKIILDLYRIECLMTHPNYNGISW